MRKIRSVTVLVVVLLAIWMSGCGAQPTPSEEPAATQAPATPAPTATEAAAPAPVEVAVEPTAAEVEAAEGDTPAPLRSIEELDSYRQQVKMVWELAGQVASQVDVLQEFVREIPASRTVMTVEGADEPASTVETVQIGDTQYAKVGDQWFVSTQEDSQDQVEQYLDWVDPGSIMSSGDCTLVGTEQVSGLDTNHYSCEQDLPAGGQAVIPGAGASVITRSTTDMWVSSEYQIAIKTSIQWEGQDADDNAVTYLYESTVSDINAPISIEPPEGTEAPAVPDDIPLIEGATNLQMAGQPPMLIVSFEVPLPVDDVMAFYNDEMPAQGWTGQASPIPGMANFEKAGRTAMVTASESDGTTTATIVIGAQ